MSKTNMYTAAQFIKAIPGTGGVIRAIARNVGCAWDTAKKYIEDHPTVKAAYQNEREAIGDVSESLIYRNVQLALEKQDKTREPVDTGDAKWVLSRKFKDRGWSERQEVSGPEGGTLRLTIVEEIVSVRPDHEDQTTPGTG
jgi:hypothetical protein